MNGGTPAESHPQTATGQDYKSTVNQVLPMRFGTLLNVPRLGWENFPGKADDSLRWSAHVFWNIDYTVIKTGKRPTVSINVHLLPKSWVKEHKKCDHLLNHEQGHFIIANLCALQFLRRVHTRHDISPEHFQDYISTVFIRTMKEYLELQKQYDQETEHRLNFKRQAQWDGNLKDKLLYYKKIFDGKKNKFLSLRKSTS